LAGHFCSGDILGVMGEPAVISPVDLGIIGDRSARRPSIIAALRLYSLPGVDAAAILSL